MQSCHDGSALHPRASGHLTALANMAVHLDLAFASLLLANGCLLSKLVRLCYAKNRQETSNQLAKYV
jgi:hypothetical protein